MPTLSAITIYPVKSCAGISLAEAVATPYGLMSGGVRDREWMIVDHTGNFLTQREYPVLATIKPRLTATALELHATGHAPLALALAPPDPDYAPTVEVRIWDDTMRAYMCDPDSEVWVSHVVGTRCRLVRFHPEARHLARSAWTDGREVATMFADGFPMLVISTASLDDLNRKLAANGRAHLPMNRFRPNLVVDGIEAFEEDYCATLQIGEVVLKPVKPCPRCPIPSIDQESGVRGPDPLDILQTYRANPLLDGAITFGMNAILLDGAQCLLRVGQEVDAELAF